MGQMTATGSNGIISKTKNIFSIVIAFLESTQNFVHFQKKDHLHSLNVSEVIEPTKCGYFNDPKLLF